MVIYSVYIINKAGSLIYHYDHNFPRVEFERQFTFPLDLMLDFADDRLVVKFGEKDGIKVGHSVLSVNGTPVSGRMLPTPNGDTDILEFLQKDSNFPLTIKFGRQPLRTNERIMLASTFHSLFAIAAQVSPEPNSSGMASLDADSFRLHCYQTITGTKFLILTDPRQENMDNLLKKIYQIYADYALKNPFYPLDMPVRFDLFDQNVQAAAEQYDKLGVSVI